MFIILLTSKIILPAISPLIPSSPARQDVVAHWGKDEFLCAKSAQSFVSCHVYDRTGVVGDGKKLTKNYSRWNFSIHLRPHGVWGLRTSSRYRWTWLERIWQKWWNFSSFPERCFPRSLVVVVECYRQCLQTSNFEQTVLIKEAV